MLKAARSASRAAPTHPLNAAIGQQRRYGTATGALADHRAIRRQHGGTVNDVVLAVVTGGLRRCPPTLHGMGARLSSQMSARMFNVVVTNVPGPQFPPYALGARMRTMYPIVPLAKGQAVSIGVTSDVDVLADSLREALLELRGTV